MSQKWYSARTHTSCMCLHTVRGICIWQFFFFWATLCNHTKVALSTPFTALTEWLVFSLKELDEAAAEVAEEEDWQLAWNWKEKSWHEMSKVKTTDSSSNRVKGHYSCPMFILLSLESEDKTAELDLEASDDEANLSEPLRSADLTLAPTFLDVHFDHGWGRTPTQRQRLEADLVVSYHATLSSTVMLIWNFGEEAAEKGTGTKRLDMF